MSTKGSPRVPVTFHDVAVYFSEDEWEDLEEWRKELYTNVMREIHCVLISMGYSIVNSDTLFRLKKEEKPYVSHHPVCKKRESRPSSGSSVPCPDILLRIKKEEEPVLYNPLPLKNKESALNPATQQPIETPIISVRIKEEEDPCLLESQHSERTGSFNSSTTSIPVATSVFSIKNKPHDSSSTKQGLDLGKGFLEMSPGTSLHMEEEEEVVQDEIEEEDVPESPSGKQHHIDEANKSDSGIIGCLDNAQKHIGSKSTAKEFQYHAAEHKEKESTDAEACHFREAEKRNKTAITGTTFHLGIESKTQPHKSTTLLKPQEDLTRDLSLQKGYAESERILQLVEKLKVFVDLQHKQYETLKCSVRQMNMHLCHQT
ncbi:uncharacterized protein LOC144770344 isoform X3 [Lissotriton helveticus]